MMGGDTKQHDDVELGNDVATGEVFHDSILEQKLDRNFSLLSISAVGIVTGNTWAALGGSIVSAFLRDV